MLYSYLGRENKIGEITPVRTTQAKTYNSNDIKYAAAHAIDKDLSTAAAAEADHDGAVWLKLEFSKS